MASNIYEPLAENGPDIRLLRNQPSENPRDSTIPVKCELFTVYFSDTPSYRALSYVWGGAPGPPSIIVNGKEFLVTDSLHGAALLHLRRDTDSLIFWIDAICINQSDLIERGQQVTHMRDIYQGAAEVVVRLGPEAKTVILQWS